MLGAYTTKSVDECDGRPTVTFPATEYKWPLADTKLHCLLTERQKCN